MVREETKYGQIILRPQQNKASLGDRRLDFVVNQIEKQLILILKRLTQMEKRSETKKRIRQDGHGFARLDVLGFDGSNWVKAKASPTFESGLGVVSSVHGVNSFTLLISGWHTIKGHGLANGFYFLSPTTDGELVSSDPTLGQEVQPILQVIDANSIILFPTEKHA